MHYEHSTTLSTLTTEISSRAVVKFQVDLGKFLSPLVRKAEKILCGVSTKL